MKADAINTVFLPLALGVIMLGLGLGLRLDDFKRIIAYPRAVAIGLASQMLILPLVCLGIAHAFDLAPELAVGLMLLAASPGGATANLFSHLAKGDVALNITLTAVNSVLSVVTLPLLVSFSMTHFMGKDHAIPLQFGKVITVVAVVLVPVAIGMVIRSRKPGVADRLDKPVRIVSAVFLVLVILASVFRERANVGDYLQQVGLAALSFNLASLLVGYVVPRVLRVERKQAIAIGMEIGIHNGTLAIAVALNVLESPTMSIPPAVYSIIMFFTAAAFGMFVARRAA
jgi:BASS family bile acid:Na+ symporter